MQEQLLYKRNGVKFEDTNLKKIILMAIKLGMDGDFRMVVIEEEEMIQMIKVVRQIVTWVHLLDGGRVSGSYFNGGSCQSTETVMARVKKLFQRWLFLVTSLK